LDGKTPELADRTLAEIGVPAWDILGARAGLQQRFYEFQGDRPAVLVRLTPAC
jgi:hypothetical protein